MADKRAWGIRLSVVAIVLLVMGVWALGTWAIIKLFGYRPDLEGFLLVTAIVCGVLLFACGITYVIKAIFVDVDTHEPRRGMPPVISASEIEAKPLKSKSFARQSLDLTA